MRDIIDEARSLRDLLRQLDLNALTSSDQLEVVRALSNLEVNLEGLKESQKALLQTPANRYGQSKRDEYRACLVSCVMDATKLWARLFSRKEYVDFRNALSYLDPLWQDMQRKPEEYYRLCFGELIEPDI